MNDNEREEWEKLKEWFSNELPNKKIISDRVAFPRSRFSEHGEFAEAKGWTDIGSERGTGRTTKQILEAPYRAVFVWCNNEFWYPRKLAISLGRKDLETIPLSWLSEQYLSGRIYSAIVVDHAAELDNRQYDVLDYLRRRATGAESSQ